MLSKSINGVFLSGSNS